MNNRKEKKLRRPILRTGVGEPDGPARDGFFQGTNNANFSTDFAQSVTGTAAGLYYIHFVPI
jgi:hypothetical protein